MFKKYFIRNKIPAESRLDPSDPILLWNISMEYFLLAITISRNVELRTITYLVIGNNLFSTHQLTFLFN